jgi:hypothetical protein
MPRMRRIRLIQPLLALLLCAWNAQAQTGTWQAVESVRPGSVISVRARYHIKCIFRSATDDVLICDSVRRGLIRLGPPEVTLDRKSVREVRLERSRGANELAGAAIGAGAGLAIGASAGNGTLTRGGGALLLGGIGGIIGGFVGRDFSILPGKIICQR